MNCRLPNGFNRIDRFKGIATIMLVLGAPLGCIRFYESFDLAWFQEPEKIGLPFGIFVYLIGVVILCILVAFWRDFPEKPSNVGECVRMWKNHADYLKWLSWASMASTAALVTLGILLVSSGQDSTKASAAIVVLGLLAGLFASVYRYVVRLAYFYEARTQALQIRQMLVGKAGNAFETDGKQMGFAELVLLLTPDGIAHDDEAIKELIKRIPSPPIK